jgi:hypothetical protein
MKSSYIILVILILLATPLWMRVAWEFSPQRRMNIMIVDKTVLNPNSIKHRSVNWILDHEKYTRSFGGFYNLKRDYFGFFPGSNEKYKVRDFEKYDESEIDSVTSMYDIAYFTDTYGIIGNEWYRHRDINERSANIYGGLSEKDILVMKKLKKKNKPVLAEYNTIGNPTPHDVRVNFQQMFQVEWTGWVGRYIASLDTTNNPDLPKWMVRQYRNQFNRPWTFKSEGFLFFNEDGRVVVMEKDKHLNDPMPVIITTKEAQLRYNLPDRMIYPFWIDIMENKNDSNKVIARYSLSTNFEGDRLLVQYNIPKTFPAIIHREYPYKFYYFCGDFADNPTKFRFSKLEGITGLKFLMYNAVDKTDRNRFFWEYYMPLMQTILEETYQNRQF